MILSDVMDEVGDRLDTIDGLRVFRWPTGAVTPPAAVVAYPETYTYDRTMRRGTDQIVLPIWVTAGSISERSTRDLLGAYLDGSGSKSIKAVLEPGPYESFGSLRLTQVELLTTQLGGVDHIAAKFLIEIAGPGES